MIIMNTGEEGDVIIPPGTPPPPVEEQRIPRPSTPPPPNIATRSRHPTPGTPTSTTSGGGSPGGGNSSSGDAVLATAGYDHTVKIWQVHTALCVKTFQHPDSQVNDLKITPDRKSVAAAGYQHVRLYDVQGSGQTPILNFEGMTKNVTCIGFNRDGQWMYSGGEDNNARIWDMRTNVTQKQFETHSSPVTCATLHPNNTELIIGDQSGTIHLWNLRSDKTEQLIPDQTTSAPVHGVAVDPLGNFLAAVNNKGDCYIWNLDGSGEELQLRPLQKIKVHKRYALSCCFSPDSSLLATTSADQTCKVWRMSDFSLLADLHCSGQRWVWSAAFTGDSQYVITASSDNLARLWTLGEGGQTKREYNGHQKPVICVAFRDPSMTF